MVLCSSLRELPDEAADGFVTSNSATKSKASKRCTFSLKYSEYFVWNSTFPLNGSYRIFFNDSGGLAMYSARLSLLLTSVRRTELSILKPEFFHERRFRANSSARSSFSTSSQMSRLRNHFAVRLRPNCRISRARLMQVICPRSESGTWMNRPASSKPPSNTRQ